ncbi:hypothetical protein GGH96_004353 [Coemansia sp. RSA 1972]|nr:hypothetical protein GGH96_004353 [Coemansia sp. RSA 1972]
MNSLQTPIRRPGGVSTPMTAPLDSPFRTPVRAQAVESISSPTSERRDAYTPRGKWTNPEAQRVLDDRAHHLSERQSTMRLRWNVASLIVLAWLSQTGVYRSVKSVGAAAGVPAYVWTWTEWAGLAVLAYNIGEAVWYLMRAQDQYADAAMTPAQRMRVGLDGMRGAGRGTPMSAPRMTPSRVTPGRGTPGLTTPGSVTDLDSRRRTPGSAGRGTVLRSPSAGRGDSDALTLTQVLKKVPGASQITDAQATPSRNGEFALGRPPMFGIESETPRLPVSRYGINDTATPLPQHLRGQPTGLYQTATPARRDASTEGASGATKTRTAGETEYLEPDEVLARYGVEREMYGWIENMHTWFVRHLLRPLHKQIAELDSLFEQHGLGHLACGRAVLDRQALEQARAEQARAKQAPTGLFGAGFGSSGVGIGGFGSSMGGTNTLSRSPGSQAVPQTLAELALRFGDLPQTKERMALEKYLVVPGYTSRSYIIARVATLAQSGALPAYVFDGGGSYDGVPWNAAEHPTDAQLLFHLFCTFLDQAMPPVQNARHPFSDRYVLQAECRPNNNLPAQIIQVSRKKPHFCLIVKGAYYDAAAYQNNLFVALVLFVLEIRRECAGYLGLTNLGGKQVDLLSVIGE